MKDAIKKKIDEVIENILNKDAKDISYSEYCILDQKYREMKYEEEQKGKREEMTKLLLDSCCGFGSPISTLPSPKTE